MQQMTDYDDLMGEIVRFLAAQADAAVAAGVKPQKIAVDLWYRFCKNGGAKHYDFAGVRKATGLELPHFSGHLA